MEHAVPSCAEKEGTQIFHKKSMENLWKSLNNYVWIEGFLNILCASIKCIVDWQLSCPKTGASYICPPHRPTTTTHQLCRRTRTSRTYTTYSKPRLIEVLWYEFTMAKIREIKVFGGSEPTAAKRLSFRSDPNNFRSDPVKTRKSHLWQLKIEVLDGQVRSRLLSSLTVQTHSGDANTIREQAVELLNGQVHPDPISSALPPLLLLRRWLLMLPCLQHRGA